MDQKYEKKHDQKEDKAPAFFPSIMLASKSEAPIIQPLHKLATQLNSASETNIILQGLNLSDGIGDFEHLLDYFNWCEEAFPQSGIKGITFVSTSKLEIAKRILPKSLVDRCYICENYLAFDPEKAKQASIIIFSGNWQDAQALDRCFATIKKLPFFASLTKKTDVLLNISTSLSQSNGGLLDCMPPTCRNLSILEYDGQPSSHLKGLPPFFEVAMGVGKDQVGIKLNETIQTYTKLSAREKCLLIMTLHNQNLLASLIDDPSIDESTIGKYLSHTKLCMGYLQKFSGKGYSGTEVFIKSMAKVHGGKFNLDIMVERGYLEELQKSAGGLNKLLDQGFTQIQLMDNTGKIIKAHPEGIINEGKKLRLIQFSGITQEDKEKLFCITEAATGSGDNSFAAVVAAKAFPFFAMPPWKALFMKSLINLASQGQMKALTTYLDLLGKEKEADKLIKFIQNNYDTIQQEWQYFCDIVDIKYNAKNYFTQLAANHWFGKIFQSAESNDITTFTTAIEPFILTGQPIFILPSEKAKATTFLEAIYLHQGLILSQKPAHPQHLDLLLHAAVLENDISLCQQLHTLGAKPILNKNMLALLDPDDVRNIFQLALANIQEDAMHGTLTWLFQNYPNLAPHALALTNAHNQTFLEAAQAQNASFNLLNPYSYTYEKVLSTKEINCNSVVADSDSTLIFKFDSKVEYVKALGQLEKTGLMNILESDDKAFYFKIRKTAVDDFLSDKPMENANKVAEYCKELKNMGYHKEPKMKANSIVIEFNDEKAARDFKQYLQDKFPKTKGIGQFLISSNESGPIFFTITERAINNIVSNLPNKANSSLDLSTPLNAGRKDFH